MFVGGKSGGLRCYKGPTCLRSLPLIRTGSADQRARNIGGWVRIAGPELTGGQRLIIGEVIMPDQYLVLFCNRSSLPIMLFESCNQSLHGQSIAANLTQEIVQDTGRTSAQLPKCCSVRFAGETPRGSRVFDNTDMTYRKRARQKVPGDVASSPCM